MSFFKKQPVAARPQPETQSEKPRKRWLFWATLLGLILCLAGYGWWSFHQPAVGTITSQKPAETAAAEAVVWKRFAGKHLEFQYPDAYREKKHETGKSPFVERVFLMTGDTFGHKIAITVEERPEGFQGSANYNLREKYPKQYLRHALDQEGKTGYWFENRQANGYERVAFFRHKHLVIDVAWSGSGSWNDRLEGEWQKMLDSIVWTAS